MIQLERKCPSRITVVGSVVRSSYTLRIRDLQGDWVYNLKNICNKYMKYGKENYISLYFKNCDIYKLHETIKAAGSGFNSELIYE